VVLHDARLRTIAAASATFNFFSNAVGPLVLIFARDDLQLAPATAVAVFGIAASIGSIGGLIGAVNAGRLARRFGLGRTLILAEFIASSGLLFLAFDTHYIAVPIFGLFSPLLIMCFFVGPLGAVIYDVNQVSLRQAIVPLKLQGRMNASIRWINWSTIP